VGNLQLAQRQGLHCSCGSAGSILHSGTRCQSRHHRSWGCYVLSR